jgi:O-antigen ligase
MLALLLYSGAARPLLGRLGDVSSGPGGRLVFWPLYLILLGLAAMHPSELLRAAWKQKALLVLAALAVASMSWSTVPNATGRRGFSLVMATILGLYFVVRFNQRERLRIICGTLGIAAIASVLVVLLNPSLGLMPDGAGWRGVFVHKNLFGKLMALSTGAFLLLAMDMERRRWMAFVGAAASFSLVVLSRSVSALLIALTVLSVTPLFRTLRLTRTRHLLLLIAAIVLAEVVLLGTYFEWRALLSILGRDPTLSGRTELWRTLMDPVMRRPWLGYGLGGFWLGWGGESGAVWSAIGWRPPHAHNGFLDMVLDLGVVGLSVFLIGYIGAWIKALRAARCSSKSYELWSLFFLTFLLLSESTESALLSQNSLIWVLYLTTMSITMEYANAATAESRPALLSRPLSLGVRRQLRLQKRSLPFFR